MKGNILIMTDSPFSERDYERFGVAILKRYFIVIVLDLTPWLKPRFWETYSSTGYPFPERHLVFNEADFKEHLWNMENVLAIDYLCAGAKSNWIREKLSLCGIRRVVTDMGGVPELSQKTFFQKLKWLKYRTNLIHLLISKVISLVSSSMRKKVLPDIALVSGSVCLKGHGIEHAKKIWAHSFDYDIYLKLCRDAHTTSRPYAVYIDGDIAHHSDYLIGGWKLCVQEDHYYPALNRFFEMFERATGMEVVFAAHPRSQWALRPHLLAGRVPVYGQTAELIRDAQLVFTNVSTAISFAVLWQIPLLFLTTDELAVSALQEEVLIRSQLFRAPLINIDQAEQITIDMDAWRVINRDAYDSYKERYIKKLGTPELPVWEIFAENVIAGSV